MTQLSIIRRTPRSSAYSTSGGKTRSASRRFSATLRPGSRPMNVPTWTPPSAAAASMQAPAQAAMSSRLRSGMDEVRRPSFM
jgi:hypothetical protein